MSSKWRITTLGFHSSTMITFPLPASSVMCEHEQLRLNTVSRRLTYGTRHGNVPSTNYPPNNPFRRRAVSFDCSTSPLALLLATTQLGKLIIIQNRDDLIMREVFQRGSNSMSSLATAQFDQATPTKIDTRVAFYHSYILRCDFF